MKKIVILFAIILIGAGATTGALTSASIGWNLKPIDEPAVLTYHGGGTGELSPEPLIWRNTDEITTYLGANISFELLKPITGDIYLSVDAASYPVGTKITITLENRGSRIAYFKGSQSLWEIDQYNNGVWEKIYPDIEFLGIFETQIVPGERKIDTWNQMTMDGQVDTGDYRVAIHYYLNEAKYEFTEYVYFSISNFIGSIGFDSFLNSTLILPEHTIFLNWNEYEDMFIPFPPIQKIPIEGLPTISIDNIPLGEYCNVTDSITIYNITDSIKIYNPDDGYWWFPIFPYLIGE